MDSCPKECSWQGEGWCPLEPVEVPNPLLGNGLQNGHLYSLFWITTRVMNVGFARNKTKQVIQLR